MAGNAQAPAAPQQQGSSGGGSGGSGQQQAALPSWPFPVGVLGAVNASDYDETKTMGAAAVKFPDVKVEPSGWLRGLWFDFTLTAASNAATVAWTEDGIFAAVDTVLFRDTGGEQIFGPFDGYDWGQSNKWGAYHPVGDPRADQNFSQTSGSGATAGSGHMTLYLPLEISAADALGDVENRSENSIYRVELTMGASTAVYSTAPTDLPTMEVKTTQDSYYEPIAAMALSGRPVADAPPSPGTLQYWKQEDGTLPATTASYLITNGIGNGYRNIIFKCIDASAGTRSAGDADWPTLTELTLGTTRTRNLYKKTWQDMLGRAFELTSVSRDTARGLENGVYPLWFTQDVGIKPGDEARRKYLRTKPGNTFKLRGNFGAACTLYVTTNYVVPKNNQFSTIVA
ncbi:MAG TPA: hypothetical protein VGG75_05650 [Trebonia sp.]|jgi:hypothetical protein